jgi:hypothetical protein
MTPQVNPMNRREFLACTSLGVAALPFLPGPLLAEDAASILPMGSAPAPLDAAWFPEIYCKRSPVGAR